VEAERDALLNAEQTKASAPPPMLLGVRGVGPEFASVLWSEGLSRHFDNRRQIAAYAGLAPTPWQSGSVNREQGISQSGNPRLRTKIIQLAWLWLRHQPRSALTLWFHDRIERNGGHPQLSRTLGAETQRSFNKIDHMCRCVDCEWVGPTHCVVR
jgi:transposase